MRNLVHRVFLDHPNSVEESYFEHFRFALGFSGTLLVAAFAAMLHAFIPAACEKTASKCINDLHKRMLER